MRGKLGALFEGELDPVQHLVSVGAQRTRKGQQGAQEELVRLEFLSLSHQKAGHRAALFVLWKTFKKFPAGLRNFMILAGGGIQLQQPQHCQVARERLGEPLSHSPEIGLTDLRIKESTDAILDRAGLFRGHEGASIERCVYGLGIVGFHQVCFFEASQDAKFELGAGRLGVRLAQQWNGRVPLSCFEQTRSQSHQSFRVKVGGWKFVQETAEGSIGLLPFLHAAESLAKQQIGLWKERAARERLNQLLKNIRGFLKFARLQQGLSRIEQRLLSRWNRRSK